MNYTTVTNPQWADAAHTSITASVTFDKHGVLPFGASASDVEPHGREIFNRAVAGDFGPIAAFVGPTVAQARAAKLVQLEQARNADERVDVTVAGKVFPASESFQAKVSRTANQTGRGKPVAGANDAWRTADAQPVVMTTALLDLIEDAITAQGAAAWTRFWQRFDAVQAATTVEQVDAVVW